MNVDEAVAARPRAGTHDHFVHFPEDDDALIDGVAPFLRNGLEAGHAAIVIMTPEHERLLSER